MIRAFCSPARTGSESGARRFPVVQVRVRSAASLIGSCEGSLFKLTEVFSLIWVALMEL